MHRIPDNAGRARTLCAIEIGFGEIIPDTKPRIRSCDTITPSKGRQARLVISCDSVGISELVCTQRSAFNLLSGGCWSKSSIERVASSRFFFVLWTSFVCDDEWPRAFFYLLVIEGHWLELSIRGWMSEVLEKKVKTGELTEMKFL